MHTFTWQVTAYIDNDPSIHQYALFCEAGLKNLVFTFPASYSLINKPFLYIFLAEILPPKEPLYGI